MGRTAARWIGPVPVPLLAAFSLVVLSPPGLALWSLAVGLVVVGGVGVWPSVWRVARAVARVVAGGLVRWRVGVAVKRGRSLLSLVLSPLVLSRWVRVWVVSAVRVVSGPSSR